MAHPAKASWGREQRVHRLAAAMVAAIGLIAVLSAVTPPLGSRLVVLVDTVGLELPLVATGATAAVGLALLVVALGLARGQRRAWRAALLLLGMLLVGHVVKGIDVEEASATGVGMLLLLAARVAFTAPAAAFATREWLGAVALALLAASAWGIAWIEGRTGRSIAASLDAGFTGLLGAGGPIAPRFVAVSTAALGFSAVVASGWLLVRRLRPDRPGPVPPEARSIVTVWGTDSLAYFALRADKSFFIRGRSVVAHRTIGRVALVSPDPIGPPGDRERIMRAFSARAHAQGWIVAVLAAAPEALPAYRALGMRALYLGDEAVAPLDNLALEGSGAKKLRQAVRKVERAGFTAEFWDPARLTEAQLAALEPLVAASRRGEAERGFSMTLGRLFDPADEGLLLAVALDARGTAQAFCQFVPAAAVGGWSLDVMRRSRDSINGLMDFLLVETMRHVAAQGATGLGLNFATLRRVVDPVEHSEDDESLAERAQRRLLHELSRSFQIESLFVFNRKFRPEWRPRYLVFEAYTHLPEISVVVARAESFWEIPVVGRFLRPPDDAGFASGPSGPAAAR